MAAPYFPEDVMIKIFLRSSVKTLVLCSCLCKSWHCIITDRSFIAKHLTKTLENNRSRSSECNRKPLFLKHYPMKNERYDFSFMVFDADSASDLVEFLDWPYQDLCMHTNFNSESHYTILNWCNGLVLLSYANSQGMLSDANSRGRYPDFVILNPSIHSFVHLPTFGFYPFSYFGGIGFDSISDDYKVVIFRLEAILGLSPCSVVNIYSLNANSWKEVRFEEQYFSIATRNRPILMNGSLHWIATSKVANGGVHSNLISRFDVSREVFDTMCLPESIYVEDDVSQEEEVCVDLMCISELVVDVHDNPWFCNFSLALAFEKLCFGHSKSSGHYCIWMMKEYGVAESWTMQYQLADRIPPVLSDGSNVEAITEFVPIVNLLGSHSNGELILERYDGQIVSCDPKSNRVTNLRIPNMMYFFYMDGFVESLVLLGSKNRAHQQLKGNSNVSHVACKKRKHEDGFGVL